MDISNLSKESIKCANSPQHPNKFSKGFKCCHFHVKKLVEKGLKLNQIDKYVDWTWFNKELKRTQVLLKSCEQYDTKKINKYTNKISHIETKIEKTFTTDDIDAFGNVSRYGSILRRSSRIQSDKTKADLNEMLIMENDSEMLELLEKWFGETVSSDILQHKKRMFYIV